MNRDKWKHDNLEVKRHLSHANGVLKGERLYNDQREFNHKKDLWRNVMAQKLGLQKIKELNKRGNELNLMNQYGEKLLHKK